MAGEKPELDQDMLKNVRRGLYDRLEASVTKHPEIARAMTYTLERVAKLYEGFKSPADPDGNLRLFPTALRLAHTALTEAHGLAHNRFETSYKPPMFSEIGKRLASERSPDPLDKTWEKLFTKFTRQPREQMHPLRATEHGPLCVPIERTSLTATEHNAFWARKS